MAWGADGWLPFYSWQSLDPGDGYGWVYFLAAFATNLVHLLFITELAGQ